MTKKATTSDVARLAGVSRTTVSFVLNRVQGVHITEETRQRVLEAAQTLNYYPDATARRMVSGRTQTIGLVLRQNPEQVYADHFLPGVLNGVSQTAAENGYHTIFLPIPLDSKISAYTHLLNERHVDGIILSGPRSDDKELLAMINEGAPVVLQGQLPGYDIPSVDVDNVGGARMAAKHLLRLGHRRVALITNADLSYTASQDRLAGYRQALEEADLPFDPALVRYGDFTPASGFRAMNDLLECAPNFTAAFIASDTIAMGAIQAVRQQGLRIPGDLALVGFDDIAFAEFVDPPLTTVHLPAFALGKQAAKVLIQLLSTGVLENNRFFLDTSLVVRSSCGANGQPPQQSR